MTAPFTLTTTLPDGSTARLTWTADDGLRVDHDIARPPEPPTPQQREPMKPWVATAPEPKPNPEPDALAELRAKLPGWDVRETQGWDIATFREDGWQIEARFDGLRWQIRVDAFGVMRMQPGEGRKIHDAARSLLTSLEPHAQAHAFAAKALRGLFEPAQATHVDPAPVPAPAPAPTQSPLVEMRAKLPGWDGRESHGWAIAQLRRGDTAMEIDRNPGAGSWRVLFHRAGDARIIRGAGPTLHAAALCLLARMEYAQELHAIAADALRGVLEPRGWTNRSPPSPG